jgi:hypothetical protein
MRSFFIGLFLSGCAFCGQAQDNVNENWSLVREDDNIFIYERWITFPKSNPPVRAREVKGEFTVHNSSVREAFDLIQNESKIKLWQKHVTEFKVYPQSDTSRWLEYSYHDIPWPVSDQDHFLEYRIQEGSTPNRVFITFETTENATLAPVREDVTRMTLSGAWLFQDLGNNRIKITYSILSMPSHIPRIFTDPVIRSNLMSTIKAYIQLLEEKK